MPNHYTIVCLCNMEYREDEEGNEIEVDLDNLEGVDLCHEVKPMPVALEGIVASHPLCRFVHKRTKKIWPDCNGPLGSDNPQAWERVPLTGDEIADLQDKHGAASWYDWRKNNYGTKWGTYGTKAEYLGGDGRPVLVQFQCAWNPPKATIIRLIEKYLSREYMLANFIWIGHDPACDKFHHDIVSAA